MADAYADPSAKSGERTQMECVWEKISDVLAGAERIRSRGKKYLPKYEGESEAEYIRRKDCAPWRPEFTDTLRSLTSKPFEKEVAFKGNIAGEFKTLAEDIDGRGNNLSAFSKAVFGKGLAKGVHGILVDYPDMEPGVTRAQERDAGARPYWLHIEADDILALYTAWTGGREFISHIRIRETVVVRSGFVEETVDRVRIYEPGAWEVWEKQAGDKEYTKQQTGVIARGASKASSVPIVLFFTGEREGELKVVPPLGDLATMQTNQLH